MKNYHLVKKITRCFLCLTLIFLGFLLPASLWSQESQDLKDKLADPLKHVEDTVMIAGQSYPNQIGGEFSPGKGFDVVKTKYASLNISLYGMARYINQTAEKDSFTDHLGRERFTDLRNDIHWHRTFIWFTGFFYTPRLRYNVSVWGLTTTDQVLLFGNLQYFAHRALRLGVGIGPNLGSRSMQGSWPFWNAGDRQMADDFFRPGFTNGFWIAGEPIKRVNYQFMIGNALSNLGVKAGDLTRDFSYSASLNWMPTTGDFGPRGGTSDFEMHEKVATRIGASFTTMKDDRLNSIAAGSSPINTQVRLSDAVLLYETGSLADGVTIQKSTYQLLSIDYGIKYKGFSLNGEFYFRNLSDFKADGELPVDEINDTGFFASASYMVIKKRLELYGVYGRVYDQFERNPYEISGGVNFFPAKVRNWRINFHVISIQKSPHSSYFGYYTAGQTGTTFSIGTDFLL
ncbi:MAG: hypothetical protein IT270_20250 [Saprospiraceae bacterium]|nr:hypothetical protein [Saprospiraceae bacterium]